MPKIGGLTYKFVVFVESRLLCYSLMYTLNCSAHEITEWATDPDGTQWWDKSDGGKENAGGWLLLPVEERLRLAD